MEIILHRRNTITELKSTPSDYGVEIDIRSDGKELILHHDPFSHGVYFKDWIQHYKNGTLILNVKEEGLEPKLIEIMQDSGIFDYFFLDQSFPFLIKYSDHEHSRSAVRVSEYESIDTALRLADRVDWVWLDCFNKFPVSIEEYKALTEVGYRICVVSPELQGRDPRPEVEEILSFTKKNKITFDAVCTKMPEFWVSCIHR